MNVIVHCLNSIDVLKSLDRASLGHFSDCCSMITVPPLQTIVAYRETSDDVYFIISGQVRAMMYAPEGREISYQDLSSGDMFGELAAIDQLPRSTHVVALAEVSLVKVSASDFMALLARHPGVALATLEKMAAVVRFLCERVYNYGALGVNSRIRAELVRLAADSVDQGAMKGAIEINNMPKHQELASRLATRREAVTKELSSLEKAGIIERQKGSFLICDIHRLQAMVFD